MIRTLFGIAAIVTAGSVAAADNGHDNRTDGTRGEPRPLVIGHRGASGYLPEHTLEAQKRDALPRRNLRGESSARVPAVLLHGHRRTLL